MSKLWLVFLHEYRRHVCKKTFLLALLSMPLVILFAFGVGYFIDRMENDRRPIGYVDHAGLLANPILPPQRGSRPMNASIPELVPLIPFETEGAAREALEGKEIQAYYVVPADYFETKCVNLMYVEPPKYNATRQFWDFMQLNLLTDLPTDIARRAVADSNLIVRWPDDAPGGAREFSQRTFLSTFASLFGGLAFILLLFMASGYLMGAVAEEKENRTIEILVTSLSPGRLIGGKVLGIVAVTLTQLLAWIGFGVLVVSIGGQVLGITLLQSFRLDVAMLAKMTVIALPAFVMVAALMTALGATVTEVHEAQQATALFALPFMAPYWFAGLLMENLNGPLAVALSLFPPTSLSTLSFRLAFAPVPNWQIAVSAALTTSSAVAALWLAGRAFRLGMLRYGQRLALRELLPGLRSAAFSLSGGQRE
jgi:ABC-2 type transport system permease protein